MTTPIFHHARVDLPLSILPDVVHLGNENGGDTKPEIGKQTSVGRIESFVSVYYRGRRKCGVDIEMASTILSVQSILRSVCVVRHFSYSHVGRRRAMSSVAFLIGHCRKCGVSRLKSLPISFRSKIFLLPFGRRHFAFPCTADVGPVRSGHIWVGLWLENVS